MDRARLDHFISRISQMIAPQGLRCIECEWSQKEQIFRVYIDHPQGVDLGKCVAANKILANWTELDDSIEGAFNLEVSSPGIERPLRLAEDFRLFLNKGIRLEKLTTDGKNAMIEGVLVGASDDSIELQEHCEQAGDFQGMLISLKDIVCARVVEV